MDEMQTQMPQQPEMNAEGVEGAEGMDEGSYDEVCIKVSKTDGSISVVLEAGDDEEGEEETPAKDIKDALRIAEQILTSLATTQSPAAIEEDAAFQQEMGSPVR